MAIKMSYTFFSLKGGTQVITIGRKRKGKGWKRTELKEKKEGLAEEEEGGPRRILKRGGVKTGPGQ